MKKTFLNPILTYAVCAFAVAFLTVGILRVVEFKAAGLSLAQRRVLVPIHIAGCLALCSAMLLLVLDPKEQYGTQMRTLFLGGVLVLFPMHIYVALKRKIQLGK